MTAAEIIVASCFLVLAIAHSVLGEQSILKPLFRASWEISEMPRWATVRILRFAWHLTSMFWVAIAALAVGADLLTTIAMAAFGSAALIFVMLRGHLAWPLFLLAGFAALHQADALGTGFLKIVSVATVLVLVAAAALHVYWAFGGRWMLDRAVPTESNPSFTPGPLLTLFVAGLLGGFAALVASVAFGQPASAMRWLVGAGIAVLTARAIGDTKVAGFTKTDRSTAFAKADDAVFTPLVVFLALGAASSLLV